MRILLNSLYYHPDPAANSVIMTQLARELSAAGHTITVICAMPHYDTNRIWPDYRGKPVRHERTASGIDIYRTWLYVPRRKTNTLGRLLNYVSFNVLSSLVGLYVPRPDVILAPSPPLTMGLTAWFLGLVRRAPYIYNVQDVYPDVAVRLGALTNSRVIALLSRLERFVYRHAGAVSVISQGFRRNLRLKGVPDGKIAVIPNFADIAFLSPRSKANAFAVREGLDRRFVVLFAGNVGMSQGLEQVLATAQQLDGHADILFLIVGNGTAKARLQKQAETMNLRNVRFLPFQPRADLPDLYGAADICLIPLRRRIAQESVPSKAFSIMAAGRPAIASVDAGSDIDRLIQEAHCGLTVAPEQPAELAKAVLRLYASPELRREMGQSGRRHVAAHHTPKVIAGAYGKLLNRIVAQKEETAP